MPVSADFSIILPFAQLVYMYHQAKKQFGQHFLKDNAIAQKICNALTGFDETAHESVGNEGRQPLFGQVIEIGPGLGVLTRILYPRYGAQLHLVEIDKDLINGLKTGFPLVAGQIYQQDFLELDLQSMFSGQLAVIGNFPYNISSQILFKIVENHRLIPEMVGMFQREVAQRVAAPPGTKVYGLISAWVQAFYDVDYLFVVNEGSFSPPPTVKSAVIRLTRKTEEPDCDHKLLLQIIKAAFNQRRKTLRNALSMYKADFERLADPSVLDKRAEQLDYKAFIVFARLFVPS